jgi:ABC-type Fe3+-hydroxamate transport system substrate-binding protein
VHPGFFQSRKEPFVFMARVRRIVVGRRAAAPGVALYFAVALVMACAGERAVPADSAMTTRETIVDDFGDTLMRIGPAQRVVSLNPVTTELLFALGAGSRTVGRTSWDLFSDAARAVPDLGAGMGPNVEAVIGQRPDLVLLYASASNRIAVQQLRAAGIATLTHRTDRMADLQRVIPVIAAALGVDAVGRVVADSVRASVDAVRALPRPDAPVRAFWHIWDAPLLTIGGGSFLSELLETAGAANVFADADQPSPAVSLEEVARRNPDVILAGPNSAKQIRESPLWQAVPAVRAGRVLVIDTTIVGRPGVRMGEAARFLRRVLVDSLAGLRSATP